MADPKFLENLNIPGVGALVVSDANAVKGAGISAATSVQNNDTTVPTGKAVTTELNKKQNTLTAGAGLAFGTGADANKLGHSNSVTAKSTSSLKKITYDAQGHVSGSSELSTAESDALASGIDSTKVAQINTNQTNIGKVQTQANWNTNNGVKNLIKPEMVQSGEYNSVTYTVNSDGSITVNGTATGGTSYVYISINDHPIDLKQFCDGNHILTGCPSGGSAAGYKLYAAKGNYAKYDYGDGVLLTETSETEVFLVIAISQGVTANNLVFRPMIRLAFVSDDTFEPYALPNTKITPELIELVDSGAKNLCNNTLATGTVSSQITATVSTDKQVTLSGTAPSNADASFTISTNTQFPAGTYIGSGCPSGGATDKYRIDYIINDSTVYRDTGNGVEFTLNSASNVRSQIVVYRGNTAPSATFKPMICSKAAWDVSQKFVPYRPTYEETVEQVAENENNISNVQTSLAVGSSDNGKVLTASYSGGTGSYAWVTPSGGGSASVVEGYISSNHNKFYSDSAKTIEIAGEANKLYVDRTQAATDGYNLYKWAYNDENSSFVRAGSEVVKGEGTYGVVVNGSSVTSATGYTASPIIGGVPYYKDTTYGLVGTKDSTGLIKNGSTVTSSSGYIASPIINGVPYYMNTTYSTASTSAAGLMSASDKSNLNKTPKVLVRSETSITASTSLADTGISYTISAYKYVRITASARYSTSNPVEIKIGTGSSDFAHVVAQSGDNTSILTAVAYAGGYSSSTTAKIYAKFSSTGTNYILLCVEEIPAV